MNPSIKLRKDNSAILTIKSRFVHEWLISLGFPSGKKPRTYKFSQEILCLPEENINLILRGLLDTDGHINARKDENYKYPYVTITTYCQHLRKQIKQILNDQGFPAFIHSEAVSVRGIANTHTWFRIIGSDNPRILNKYNEFCVTGKILPGP